MFSEHERERGLKRLGDIAKGVKKVGGLTVKGMRRLGKVIF